MSALSQPTRAAGTAAVNVVNILITSLSNRTTIGKSMVGGCENPKSQTMGIEG